MSSLAGGRKVPAAHTPAHVSKTIEHFGMVDYM